MGDRLASGAEALRRGDWQAAKDAYTGSGESADALAGLGEATFWLGDIAQAVEIRQRAYVAFRDLGDTASAARMALWLATEHGALGNPDVATGWLARAERLVDELGSCRERGWLLLRRSRTAGDAGKAEQLAREALVIAHAHDDRDLEIAAISQQGRALLAGGRTRDGFARLDEAMAAATSGETSNHATVSDTCCDMIIACERTMAIERATQWCQVTDDYARRINFLPLFAFCRVTYAGVLIAIGRWADAEHELGEALASYRASLASRSILAIAKLAELRLLQGRDAEAEALVAEHMHEPSAALVIARLCLARGDADGAARVVMKRLAAVEHDVLLAAPALALAVDAHIANDDADAANAAATRLDAIARATECKAFAAAAAHAAGLVTGDAERFETAIATYASIGMPLMCARSRLALARAVADRDPAAAKQACRAAIATFEELGARRDLDAAAELRRRLGVGAKVGPRSTTKLTKRELEVLALIGLGLSNAKIGARLFISPKTVEHHVGHILEKLELDNRAAAAAYAAKHAPSKPGTK